jgi:ribosomal protein L16/L10AE
MALWTYTARVAGQLTVGEIDAPDIQAARVSITRLLRRHGLLIINRIFRAPTLRSAEERFVAEVRVFRNRHAAS